MAKRRKQTGTGTHETELAEQTLLADAGEAAAVFLHELGNVLNNILLDTKLLQGDLPDEHHERLGVTCELITETARKMKALADYRQRCRPQAYTVDLASAISDAAVSSGAEPFTKIQLSPGQLLVVGSMADIKRLFRLLLEDALAEKSSDQGCIAIVASHGEKGIEIRLEHDGPVVNDEELRNVFEPYQTGRKAEAAARLAICQNLVRHTGGTINVQSRSKGGRVFQIRLPQASS